MRSRESAIFIGTAIPAGIMALSLTAWLTSTHAAQLAPLAPDLALMVLFASLSHYLSFSPAGPSQVSLELAYFIVAAVALPFPSSVIVGAASGLVGSLLRVETGLGASLYLAVLAANVAIATLMTGAACAASSWLRPALSGSEHVLFSDLLLAASLFLVMNVVDLAAMMAWVASRREPPLPWARQFLTRILPGEAVTVPFGCLLVFMLDSQLGHLGFVLLAVIGLFMSYLLKTIGDSRQRLRQVNQELEKRVGELATLNAIGREISSSLDPTRVFRIVRRECRKVFRPDFFWIARIDHDTREVHVEHSMAGDFPSHATSFPLGQGLVSYVVTTERPLLIADISRDPLMKTLRPIVVEPRIRSILAVPLLVESRVVGVLSVQCFRENAYEERHVSLLTTIGQQAAVALENARHYQLATIDQLTGLYQRDYFFQRLGDEHRRASRYGTTFSILMLDLDSFKRINDRSGHFAGDRFLKAVGAAIKRSLRSADVACRYGGEEFCLLLTETELAGAWIIAERIRGEIGALRLREGSYTLSTTVSIGISSYPVHYDGNLAGLVQKADQALYSAKKQGKDRVIAAAG